MSPEQIARLMAAFEFSPAEQLKQTEFRCQLVESWQVLPGQRILEVGCGQGDMTAALAAAVGPTGFVLAVDSAEGSYGSPVSLGDSGAVLLNSELGPSIQFKFGCQDLDFIDSQFDVVVMANCSWYFSGFEQFVGTLVQAHSLSPRLMFSEWDSNPTSLNQLGHFLAVQYAKLAKLHYAEAELNIRNALSRDSIKRCLSAAGWSVVSEQTFDQLQLADGKWEIDMCLEAAGHLASDQRLAPLVDSIRANRHYSDPLPIFSLVAEQQLRPSLQD